MTAFIIAVMVYFILSLGLSLMNLAINASQDKATGSSVVATLINIMLSLGFLTWSIILLAS
jgi:hypothetical protein